MNFWGGPAKEGFKPACFDVLEKDFVIFFEKTVPENPLKAEYLLQIYIGGLLKQDKCTVKVLETKAKSFGVTYKENKEAKELIDNGVYEQKLYSDL